MVCLFRQLVTMCPKLKHLKHFVLEVLVGDLGAEGKRLCLETLWEELVSFEKLEGEEFVELLFVSFQEDL